jgi:hypothetical protein
MSNPQWDVGRLLDFCASMGDVPIMIPEHLAIELALLPLPTILD